MEENKSKRTSCGRPAKKPQEKIAHPVRALVTTKVASVLQQAAAEYGSLSSDILRLYIFRGLKTDGLLSGLENDPTWSNLDQKGLI